MEAWFSVSVPRSAKRVLKLWTGRQSGVSFVSALAFARSETSTFSTGEFRCAGAPSRSQREQIGLAASLLPNVRTVVLAQDHDEAEERQAETLRERLEISPHVKVRRRGPQENADWNDVVDATTKG